MAGNVALLHLVIGKRLGDALFFVLSTPFINTFTVVGVVTIAILKFVAGIKVDLSTINAEPL